ncbi:nucleolar GTP-binding protein 1 [Stemphylium lycopersici]|nr:nucleolar GTP-binding protein 1 [Stemphylium lycopersici]
MKTQWKDIPAVPTSQEFLDIVLSRTQRRLPTQIRAGFKISRIRAFYTRKVKYTSETFVERLSTTIEAFPRLADIHPFHRDLLNTLYDADHFRIALGQLSTAKSLIETVARDYVRLLKYGQSLFQCKQLKRAALGRMATICKRLKDPLVYLEQVRQHLGRLPSIDPNTRTLVISGFPNVGKSSFLKSISRADVEVQPYAFTTKSLYVGHFDYKMLRFQAVDTPGILDHALEDMNTIEHQSICAIAHLRAHILYFMDLSEQCGYSVASQIALFNNIKPLFANKLISIVVNKIDLMRPDQLDPETQAQLQGMLKSGEVEMLELSCSTTEGVMAVRNAVCDRLIAARNAEKLKAGTNSAGEPSGRLGELLRRIHVAQPLGGVTRETSIPEAVLNRKKYDKEDPDRPLLERDLEEENGGAGVYNIDLRKNYLLDNDEWKHDRIPEVFKGQNVYDFIDPDIEAKLAALEAEEEKLEGEGFYESDDDLEDAEEADIRYKAELIREKRQLIRNEAKMRKSLKNRAVIPRTKKAKQMSQMESHLESLGYDTSKVVERAQAQAESRGRSLARSRSEAPGGDAMDVDTPKSALLERAKSRGRSQSTNRRNDGVTDEAAASKAEKMAKLSQKKMNRMARQGEADRHQTGSLIKHLTAGKRGIGKTSHSTDIFRDVGLVEAEPVGTRMRKCRVRNTDMYVWLFGEYRIQKWDTNARVDFTHLIHPRHLELRQDNDCPPSYTSLNGLNFTSYCNQRNPNNDAMKDSNGIGQWYNAKTRIECLERCSRFDGDGEGCFGAVWHEDSGECWFRNSNVSTSGLEDSPTADTWLVDKGEMDGFNTDCPNEDQSMNDLPGFDGVQYKTHCGQRVADEDDDSNENCFGDAFDCWENSVYRGFYHTESLEECVKICMGLHPFCTAVSWNPGLEVGFANCWPTSSAEPKFGDPKPKEGIMHGARVLNVPTITTTCPESDTYTTGNDTHKAEFEIHCGQLNPGSNITMLHTNNVTACMDACAASDEDCKGILFDSTMHGGYENCYLQNSKNVISDMASATYAVRANVDVPSDDSGSSSNKAWIAGPVIGGVVALAAIGFAIFWWRRKKASKSTAIEKDAQPGSGPPYNPGSYHDGAGQAYYNPPTTRAEVEATSTSELPANIKYANNYGPKSEAQELP